MQVKSIAECSKGIFKYVRPSLSFHFPLRLLFCLYLRQVLLYIVEKYGSYFAEAYYILHEVLVFNYFE